MKLEGLEWYVVNSPARAASQRLIETPLLVGRRGALSGQYVLEIGCGRGVGMQSLLRLDATHVVGFDVDPRMVALAQKRVARYGRRAHVYVGDAEAIDMPDGTFEAVVEYGVFHHVHDWQQALREVARVLRPGGIFYFEDFLKGFVSAPLIRVLFGHGHVTEFTAQEFRAGLEAAGLQVRRWRSMVGWTIAGQAEKKSGGRA